MTENELMKVAFKSCVDMMGYDFVRERKDLILSCYGYRDNLFNYTLLVNEKEPKFEKKITIDETPFDYHATVYVDVNTGEVTRDYENSILPN